MKQLVQDHMKDVGDAVAVSGWIVAVATDVLPILASVLSIIWLGIRIYDRFKYGRDGKGKE